jgi:hypothetical protein
LEIIERLKKEMILEIYFENVVKMCAKSKWKGCAGGCCLG